jgi:hypothetical protein
MIMKPRFLLKVIAVIACSTIFAMSNDEIKAIEDFPDHFSSEKELKEKVFAKEWLSETVGEKQFFISRVLPLQAGRSRERVTCWYNDTRLSRVVSVWDIRFNDVGPVKLRIDKDTSTLTVAASANAPFNGKILASVVLSSLGP